MELNRSTGDISDVKMWSRLERSDVVMHLAGRTFIPQSWQEPQEFLRTNLDGTVCALEYCRRNKSRMIYLSSYLYGNSEVLPTPESAKLVVSNPYALSKKIAEETCKFYFDFYGVQVTVLRPFNVYGPGQSSKFLIPSIIFQAVNNQSITVNDLCPKRDYVYIEDLVDFIIDVGAKQIGFDTFNIGTGVSYSVLELIELVQEIMGTHLEIKSNATERLREISDTRADITKAKNILSWVPKVTLREGLKQMIDHLASP
jgi:nucleoside-diphosphate-sugar epimerase